MNETKYSKLKAVGSNVERVARYLAVFPDEPEGLHRNVPAVRNALIIAGLALADYFTGNHINHSAFAECGIGLIAEAGLEMRLPEICSSVRNYFSRAKEGAVLDCTKTKS